MPIDLHEKFSEFSYGYGVTREVEHLLGARSLRVTPFLPSLVHEASLGFDVAFNKPGNPILIQFKLGEQLSRFRPTNSVPNAPHPLGRPYWRYKIDTSEDQFINLRDWEQRGCDAYYASPRFATWFLFDSYFRSNAVLRSSLLIRPTDIASAVATQTGSLGAHRILYDRHHCHVCSDPTPIDEVSVDDFLSKTEVRVRGDARTLGERLKVIVRREEASELTRGRQRAADIRRRAKSEADADAAILALEAWTKGAQVLFVTET